VRRLSATAGDNVPNPAALNSPAPSCKDYVLIHALPHLFSLCRLWLAPTGGSKHRNPWRCATAIYDAHGLAGFWRGWLANYARLGPQTVMTFLVVEQLRGVVGMEPL
jgi:hypothetical protein